MLPTIIILKRSSFATANCQFPLPRNLFLGRQCRNKSQAEAEKFNGTARIENPPKQPLLNLKAEITSIFTSRYTIRNALVPRFIALRVSSFLRRNSNFNRIRNARIFHSKVSKHISRGHIIRSTFRWLTRSSRYVYISPSIDRRDQVATRLHVSGSKFD